MRGEANMVRGMIWRGANVVRLRTGGVGERSRRRGWRAVIGGVDSRRAEVGSGGGLRSALNS
jgi:hypothetical protein